PYDVTGWTLPSLMGVEVRAIDTSFEPPVMSHLTTPAVVPPPVTVWGDKRPSYYLVETRSTAGALAINRLAAANLKASWLDAPVPRTARVPVHGHLDRRRPRGHAPRPLRRDHPAERISGGVDARDEQRRRSRAVRRRSWRRWSAGARCLRSRRRHAHLSRSV